MVCVLSSDNQPLDPCHPARARQLLARGRARVRSRFPFTIQLTDRTRAQSTVGAFRLKLDPGSQTSGLAILNDQTGQVVFLAEVTHRGAAIRAKLQARAAFRRNRRQRKTRYRPARFHNRRRPLGWLAPSLQSRVDNLVTWSQRLARRIPLAAITLELVRFDTQRLQDAEIAGVAYQQGTLAGYEVREYLLEKWGRQCAYCEAMGVPLQIEHLMPTSRGGSDRVRNLTLACGPCNQDKGKRTAAEYGFPALQTRAQQPLRDAAAVNSTRWALYRRLMATGLPLEVGTGGQTKYQRTQHGLPKTHAFDAVCVGASTPERLRWATGHVLAIQAMGRGTHARTRLDAHGFPRLRLPRQKRWFGVQTGDMVRAEVPQGKHAGVHVGGVAVRSSGSFNLTTAQGTRQGIGARWCRVIQRADGYRYAVQPVWAEAAEAGRSAQG